MLNRSQCRSFLFALAVLLFSWPAAAQDPAADPVLVTISGEVERPLDVKASDLARLDRKSARVSDHGKEATFEGVALADVLKLAGVSMSEHVRGKHLVQYLLVDARDGYRVVFSLAELDGAFTDRVVLLADKRDGKPLSAEEGPLRIVVPGEKRAGRWVRQVKGLKVGSIQ